jgi:hypothetical protein
MKLQEEVRTLLLEYSPDDGELETVTFNTKKHKDKTYRNV